MSVTAEISQHLFGTAERRLGVDDPVNLSELVEAADERGGIGKAGEIAEEAMIEDMTVRNLSPATQRSYLNAISKFSRYFGRSPDHLGLEDVHAFQVHLVATGISWPALNQIVCALRLLEPRGPVQEHHLTACEFAKLDRHAGR